MQAAQLFQVGVVQRLHPQRHAVDAGGAVIGEARGLGARGIGFQGDFTFDSAVVSFSTPQVQAAGLTATNWNVSSNILNTGPGSIKTLRLSAFSLDFTPLNGSGTLFELRMLRVSSTSGAMSPLVWKPAPDNFIFIDKNLDTHATNQTNGLITITGSLATPTAAPSPTPGGTTAGDGAPGAALCLC